MTELVLTRYIHFIGILIVFGMVLSELVLVQKELKRSVIKRMFVFDGIYGAFSLVVVGAGLYLWLGIGKSAEFYTSNPLMHAKVGLFILVGVLSLWPTVFYFKNRKGRIDEVVKVPSYIKRIIQIELGLLIIIPLLATLMAQGVGL
ncbi:MAG: DUF2214 family protein [Bacteroidota bacterium]